eukprot:406120_1
MFKSLQRLQHGARQTLSVYTYCNSHHLQRPFILSLQHFTETSIEKEHNESIKQTLPDPHVLVTDPNDPTGKARYNTENTAEEDIDVSDEQFVDGMIVALEEWCPEVNSITDDEKLNMVKFVEKNKNNRINRNGFFPENI